MIQTKWRNHTLRRVKVNSHFKLGVWLGGMLYVPSEERTYDKIDESKWRTRKWEEYGWQMVE